MVEMLTRLIVLIILQYIQILNHYVVHLKLIYFCMPIMSQYKKGGKWIKAVSTDML